MFLFRVRKSKKAFQTADTARTESDGGEDMTTEIKDNDCWQNNLGWRILFWLLAANGVRVILSDVADFVIWISKE